MSQKLLNNLERRFGKYAIHNITLHIIGAQVLFWALIKLGYIDSASMVMNGEKVLQGEWWRMLTFICMPPDTRLIFILFAWLIFNLMGSSLDEHWGTFKYNLYLFIGYIGSILACIIPALVTDWPPFVADNMYFEGSIFFAFAYLFPHYEFLLFFFLPVKVKWLALLSGAFFALGFMLGGMPTRLLILGGVANFFIFFGKEINEELNSRGKKRSLKPKHFIHVTSAE